jgi:peptidoglycan/LPS O-acetylase OafA/YrhL
MCVGTVVHLPQDGWTYSHYVADVLGVDTWIPWPMGSAGPTFAASRGINNAINGTLWTVQTELAFYVVFPALLLGLRRLLGVNTVSDVGRGEGVAVHARAAQLLALALLFSAMSVVPTLLFCYGPMGTWAAVISSYGLDSACYSDWIDNLYGAPYCRISEFVLGMITATLYLLTVTEAAERPEDAQSSALLRFLSSHWLLYSPWSLLLWSVGLATLLIELANPAIYFPGQTLVLGNNPGSFALGFAMLLLLLVNTAAPLGERLTSRRSSFSPVAFVLTLPVALTMGELSYAFYAFHGVPKLYTASLGFPWPRSVALAFVATLGLAIPAHAYVEVPAYQWISKRLPKCDCHDDHVGLTDIHREQRSG